MISSWRTLLILLSCLWLVACGGGGGGSSSPVVLVPPTTQPTLRPTTLPTSSGNSLTLPLNIRSVRSFKLLEVPMTVAGNTSNLLLDTGSSGIRILSSVVGSAGLQRTGTPANVVFADGTRFTGELATAPVSFGSVATESDILLQLVDSVTCDPVPGCIGDQIFSPSGFVGILGTSQANRSSNSRVYNPLTRLPGNLDSGYIIRTGGFNNSQGDFIVGLTPENSAGFNLVNLPQVGRSTFEDGTPVWDDANIQPLYTIEGSSILNAPGRTLFDSGTSDILLASNALGSNFTANPLATGRVWTANLSGVFSYRIQVGFPTTPGIDRIFVNASGSTQVLGMPFFFKIDTLFDINQGRIGFRAPA